MNTIADNELLEYIKEDLPYFDLTTHLQNSNNQKAKLEIFTREDIVVSCTEEAARIAQLLSCEVNFFVASKKSIKKDEVLIEIQGDYNNIHQAYKLLQVLLEYSCKIATTTYNMSKLIKNVNPTCELLTTRKSFPFAKKFCINSILNGGGMPHRLGLSESILFFKQHRKLYSSNKDFYEQISKFKNMAVEKKVVVESSDIEDIKQLMEYGVDVIQIDKGSVDLINQALELRKKCLYENIRIIAAGGINIKNAEAFAKTGVDAIVTSSLYNCGMADLGTRLELIK
ncbi:MAG: ModD protein [Halarcobacter sp.]